MSILIKLYNFRFEEHLNKPWQKVDRFWSMGTRSASELFGRSDASLVHSLANPRNRRDSVRLRVDLHVQLSDARTERQCAVQVALQLRLERVQFTRQIHAREEDLLIGLLL